MMGTVRFLAGLTLVVVGVALAAPFFVRLAEVSSGTVDAAGVHGDATGNPWGSAPAMAAAPSAPGAFCIPDPHRAVAPQNPLPASAPAPVDPGLSDAALVPGLPSLPDALPDPPADLTLAPPPVAPSYRSTLDIPPPPLLDVDAASPLVAAGVPAGQGIAPSDIVPVTAAGAIRTVSATPVTASSAVRQAWHASSAPAAGDSSPTNAVATATYVVRDGDDLTNIASRLYGHPGAAEAIWNANRDRLADPAVLPIGLSLRLPAQWAPATVRPASAPATVEPVRRPTSVTVGPGETLETLAQRFYGDKSWATRLWEANRDHLRSPALLVAGMELRLP